MLPRASGTVLFIIIRFAEKMNSSFYWYCELILVRQKSEIRIRDFICKIQAGFDFLSPTSPWPEWKNNGYPGRLSSIDGRSYARRRNVFFVMRERGALRFLAETFHIYRCMDSRYSRRVCHYLNVTNVRQLIWTFKDIQWAPIPFSCLFQALVMELLVNKIKETPCSRFRNLNWSFIISIL